MPVLRWTSVNRWLHAVVLLTAAWFGVGYQGEDEFQQVLLVAEHLRGHVDVASLPLDIDAGWRSMLLPLAACGVFESAGILGIRDPFALTFLLRLLTAAFALATMHRLSRAVQEAAPRTRTVLDGLGWFLWFMPVLLVRFNGETWSGLLFALGLALLLEGQPRRTWAIGALWATAIACRPAAAILPLGAMLWVALTRHEPLARALRIVAGGAAALMVLVVLDSLAYGRPIVTLWNYGVAALTGEEAWRFTALPWYQYPLFVLKHATLPIGALLIAALIALLAFDRKHVLVWLLLPFVVLHSALPVKELRFLFPLAPLMPWLLVAGWNAVRPHWSHALRHARWLLVPIGAANALALVVALLTPAGNGRIALARTIARNSDGHAAQVLQVGDWRQWIPAFYLPPGSTENGLVHEAVARAPADAWIIAHASAHVEREARWTAVACATPPWTHRWLRLYGLEDDYDPLVLFRAHDAATDR
jgi:phosphatidylinositol glycan class B